MTDAYDNENVEHRRIRLDIEQGDGIAQMFTRKEGIAAMEDAGFELQHHEDLAAPGELDAAPWYWPLGSDFRYVQTVGDALTCARMNPWGRFVAHNMFSAMEMCWLAPKGTRKTAESLAKAADALVQGGKQRLFTPMYLMVGKKPEA
jgi:sterol 24-C-methyltransferase